MVPPLSAEAEPENVTAAEAVQVPVSTQALVQSSCRENACRVRSQVYVQGTTGLSVRMPHAAVCVPWPTFSVVRAASLPVLAS